jgi:hypothetical protein
MQESQFLTFLTRVTRGLVTFKYKTVSLHFSPVSREIFRVNPSLRQKCASHSASTRTSDLDHPSEDHLPPNHAGYQAIALEGSNPFLEPLRLRGDQGWVVEGVSEYGYALRCG